MFEELLIIFGKALIESAVTLLVLVASTVASSVVVVWKYRQIKHVGYQIELIKLQIEEAENKGKSESNILIMPTKDEIEMYARSKETDKAFELGSATILIILGTLYVRYNIEVEVRVAILSILGLTTIIAAIFLTVQAAKKRKIRQNLLYNKF